MGEFALFFGFCVIFYLDTNIFYSDATEALANAIYNKIMGTILSILLAINEVR